MSRRRRRTIGMALSMAGALAAAFTLAPAQAANDEPAPFVASPSDRPAALVNPIRETPSPCPPPARTADEVPQRYVAPLIWPRPGAAPSQSGRRFADSNLPEIMYHRLIESPSPSEPTTPVLKTSFANELRAPGARRNPLR